MASGEQKGSVGTVLALEVECESHADMNTLHAVPSPPLKSMVLENKVESREIQTRAETIIARWTNRYPHNQHASRAQESCPLI